MSLADKITEVKRIISLVCDVVPSIVTIIKEIVILLKGV